MKYPFLDFSWYSWTVKFNTLTLQVWCHHQVNWQTLCLLFVISGLASSLATNSAACSGPHTWTSAHGWERTSNTRNRPRKRVTTCESSCKKKKKNSTLQLHSATSRHQWSSWNSDEMTERRWMDHFVWSFSVGTDTPQSGKRKIFKHLITALLVRH